MLACFYEFWEQKYLDNNCIIQYLFKFTFSLSTTNLRSKSTVNINIKYLKFVQGLVRT